MGRIRWARADDMEVADALSAGSGSETEQERACWAHTWCAGTRDSGRMGWWQRLTPQPIRGQAASTFALVG